MFLVFHCVLDFGYTLFVSPIIVMHPAAVVFALLSMRCLDNIIHLLILLGLVLIFT